MFLIRGSILMYVSLPAHTIRDLHTLLICSVDSMIHASILSCALMSLAFHLEQFHVIECCREIGFKFEGSLIFRGRIIKTSLCEIDESDIVMNLGSTRCEFYRRLILLDGF